MVFSEVCEARTKVIVTTDPSSETQGQSHSMSVTSGETARQSLQARAEEVSSLGISLLRNQTETLATQARLTAPESPRMDRSRYTKTDK